MKALPKNKKYEAALYMRLSKDDDGTCESASIQTQRKMLRLYAAENGFSVYHEYVDDGVSGTTFDRPAFKRMIQDIEDKKVNLVITKDLSRLGRDYILAGQYTEIYFPSKQVRCIAINDGYDSESPYTDIAPFKNVINEMYARDISKKIRSAFATSMQEGAFVAAFAPYGYKRDPDDKHHLIIDETAAKIVEYIFGQAAKGVLPSRIAKTLNERAVPTPLQYRCLTRAGLTLDHYTAKGEWSSSTITKMLRNIVYLGHMVQGKTTKVSFKSRITVQNPKESWHIVENTHEPIVSAELFHMASRRSHQRTCAKKGGFTNVFSGIAKCADCGKNMSTVGSRRKGARANLACGAYKLHGSKACSNHFIDYDVLYQIVLKTIQNIMRLSKEDQADILKAASERVKKQQDNNHTEKEILSLKKRKQELDFLIEKIYEDYAKNLLCAERMRNMLRKYEAESKMIDARLQEVERRQKEADGQGKESEGKRKGAKGQLQVRAEDDSLKKIRALLRVYTETEALTPELLYRLIERIEVSQGDFVKSERGKVRKQTIKIVFRFSGVSVTEIYEV